MSGTAENEARPRPPVTAYVRESYAREKHPDDATLTELRRQGFDEWLAAHDARVRAEALRDAAEDMDNTDDPDWIYVSNGDIDLWLRARADRIAADHTGGEN